MLDIQRELEICEAATRGFEFETVLRQHARTNYPEALRIIARLQTLLDDCDVAEVRELLQLEPTEG